MLCHRAARGAAAQYCCATGLRGGRQSSKVVPQGCKGGSSIRTAVPLCCMGGGSAVQLCHRAARGAAAQYCCATGLQARWAAVPILLCKVNVYYCATGLQGVQQHYSTAVPQGSKVGSSAVQLCHRAARGAAVQYSCATGLQGVQQHCSTAVPQGCKGCGSSSTVVPQGCEVGGRAIQLCHRAARGAGQQHSTAVPQGCMGGGSAVLLCHRAASKVGSSADTAV
jgi:hypothetical protein